MNKDFETMLDMSRWTAALLVVISHVRHFLLIDFRDVQDKGLAIKGLYFVTGFGHEAVVIFFVISGVLVGGITLNRWRTRGVQFGNYFAHRVSRIYTVFIPALVGGFVLDYIGLTLFNGGELYTNSAQYHIGSLNSTISNNISLAVFLGNLLMLGNIAVPVLGSNGPLWSLYYEWWYYCLFAVFLGIFFAKQRISTVCLIALIGMAVVLPAKLLIWMSIWALGILTLLYCDSSWPKPNVLLACAVFVGAMVLSRLSHNQDNLSTPEPMYVEFLRDFGLGVAYSLLLSAFHNTGSRIIPLSRLHKWLADFSYSLYLVHFPMLVILVAAFNDYFGLGFFQQPRLTNIYYFCGVTLLLYAYAFLFSLVTERHTRHVRSAIVRMLRMDHK